MLNIKKQRKPIAHPGVFTLIAFILLGGGGYLLALVVAPTVAPIMSMKPIIVNALPAPAPADNRIVIPKIGVNIAYSIGAAALENGAEWRYPERGDPDTGGNFIIAAHRFTLAPTPTETIRKSPFYNIDKLVVGDKIVVDYKGIRYGYEVAKIFNVKPEQIEIEAPSEDDKLTLYSCELSGAEAGRDVIVATPLGKVVLANSDT